ncbi:hypothetical protein [Crocosphaera chwakensis]|uniref:Uncharacterized protein n=1 Tax=Crocosphaera chwakensis CCY0110 TaxID=391612 RepID=A3IWM0_9CHRO|nr:hypothetical protein [Crocosphaera chwakensis]EAZ89131.1 hypothetical protein CY0110_12067 [Crocosphaera chwakensis CCY0110]
MNRSGRNNSEEQTPQSSNIFTLFKGILTNPLMNTIIIPSLIGLLTALLANVFAPDVSNTLTSNGFILITTLLSAFWGFCFLLSCWNSSRIWMTQENYFRETYSLSAFYSIIIIKNH